jgi:ArsR family transcriptional regulator, arsenate/arsenite/antimonite-responsive transcriptional repressor / arsenate reductase (thioredoxin)
MTNQSPDLIKLLGHDLRWSMLKALTLGDYQVHEFVDQLHVPLNLISYHLKLLREGALVTPRRSEADARDIYYSLDLTRLRELYQAAGQLLHPTMGMTLLPPMTQQLPPVRVLFICTHNSARSQMAEGFLRALSQRQVQVASAGSEPTQVHPQAIETMDGFGIDIRPQSSRHIQEFSEQAFDYVITVCDRAREVCPIFAGAGHQFHWGFPDPLLVEEQRRPLVFEQTAQKLKSRVEYFLSTLASAA